MFPHLSAVSDEIIFQYFQKTFMRSSSNRKVFLENATRLTFAMLLTGAKLVTRATSPTFCIMQHH
jgi:hypothetical protein